MKRILLLLVAAVAVLAGCSQKEQQEIIFWNNGILYEDPNEQVANEDMPLSKAIAEFEKNNPDYKVTVVNYENDAFNQAFTAANQAGKGPDVVSMWAGSTTLGYQGYLEDLKGYMSEDELKMYDTSSLTHVGFEPDGALVGLPGITTATGIFYNKEIMEANKINTDEIKTWDDYIAVSKSLSKNDVTPLCVGDVDGYTSTWAVGEFFIDQVGPQGLADLYNGKVGMDSEEMANSLASWKEIFDAGLTNPDWASTNDGDALKRFTEGSCATMVQGSWALHGFSDMGENFGVIKFPSIDADAPYADYIMSQPTQNVAVTNYSEKKEKAVEFAKLISTPEFILETNSILYGNEYTSSISDVMQSWADQSAMGFDSATTGEAASEFYKLAPSAVRGDLSIDEFLKQVQAANSK